MALFRYTTTSKKVHFFTGSRIRLSRLLSHLVGIEASISSTPMSHIWQRFSFKHSSGHVMLPPVRKSSMGFTERYCRKRRTYNATVCLEFVRGSETCHVAGPARILYVFAPGKRSLCTSRFLSFGSPIFNFTSPRFTSLSNQILKPDLTLLPADNTSGKPTRQLCIRPKKDSQTCIRHNAWRDMKTYSRPSRQSQVDIRMHCQASKSSGT